MTRPVDWIRASIALAMPVVASAQGAARGGAADSLRIYYVGKPVGWEHYSIATRGDTTRLDADFDYIDRGRRIHTASSTILAADYSPRRLELFRLTDTSRTLDTRVEAADHLATVMRRGVTVTVPLPPLAFAIAPYTPVSQHVALIRYWRAHGRPSTIDVVPGGPTSRVSISLHSQDSLRIQNRVVTLTGYAIDGVVWGREYAWLDERDRLVLFTSAAGGLSTKAIRADFVSDASALMRMAASTAIRDLTSITARDVPVASGAVALVGATLVDGTGRPAVKDAVVVVRDGRIAAAGPAETTRVPRGATTVDVRGKTIVPGLWDMHAHLHQIEWVPVYLAAGVTTVRDMGNEEEFFVALRRAVSSGQARGPRILAAGLIDGPGPNAFGAMSASTPAEARAIVHRYHELGFEQMKLYSLLAPDVVAAITREAHTLGMTVTGHVPNALSLLAAVDSGMDQVAHLPIRAEPGSDSLARIIDHLRSHGTVLDPTASWGEIGGHSTAESVQSFQPVLQHLPLALIQTRVMGWGSPNVDTATAHARLARTLSIIGALHEAGVPIVAGTDEGVPGFSVYRELELYVRAGFSPMDAIRAATAVPAIAMRLDKELGTLEPGKRADLLVLDANPLDDISNIRRVRSVMTGGALYDSAALWRVAGFTP